MVSFRNDNSDTYTKPVSVILSSKVSAGGLPLVTSKAQQPDEPIILQFEYFLVIRLVCE